MFLIEGAFSEKRNKIFHQVPGLLEKVNMWTIDIGLVF